MYFFGVLKAMRETGRDRCDQRATVLLRPAVMHRFPFVPSDSCHEHQRKRADVSLPFIGLKEYLGVVRCASQLPVLAVLAAALLAHQSM